MMTRLWIAVIGAALLVSCRAAPKAPEAVSQVDTPVQEDTLVWQSLFDGDTLAGWKSIEFGAEGPTHIFEGVLNLEMGGPFTGILWTNDVIRNDYEIELDAKRVVGNDFFCGLTFPVDTNCCSLIVGGWGGALIGISSINDMDASENSTTGFLEFNNNQWYRIRLRVIKDRLQAWIDDKQVVDVDIRGKRIGVRPGDIEECRPLGIACWDTGAAFKNINIRKLSASEVIADTPTGEPPLW